MTRKREHLYEGEYDMITEDMRRMRKRFIPPVLRDLGAWLLMQWLREAARSEAADTAESLGNVEWALGVRAEAQKCCDIIQQVFGRIHEAWSVKDWHRAQDMLELMIAARDPFGMPLHPLGGILTAHTTVIHGTDSPGSGTGLAVEPGLPPTDGRSDRPGDARPDDLETGL
jgi:hypothetical protein